MKAAQYFQKGQKSKNWDIIKKKITTAKVNSRTYITIAMNMYVTLDN